MSGLLVAVDVGDENGIADFKVLGEFLHLERWKIDLGIVGSRDEHRRAKGDDDNQAAKSAQHGEISWRVVWDLGPIIRYRGGRGWAREMRALHQPDA